MSLEINIGKGLTMTVDPQRLNAEVTAHVMKIGLRNILMDSHANATAKADPQGYIQKSRDLAEKKLAAMYEGIVRTQAVGGPKAPTDPVSQVIMRLARKQVQKDKAKDLAAAPKDQRLALLNKLLTEYALTHETELRPRAVKIVALENDEEPEAKPMTRPAKRK